MSFLQTLVPKPFSHFPLFFHPQNPNSNPNPHLPFPKLSQRNPCRHPNPFFQFATSATANPKDNSSNSDQNPNPNPRKRGRPPKPKDPLKETATGTLTPGDFFPATIPGKPRRGRRSEAEAVEDFVRDSLQRTFISIREQNAEVLDGPEGVFKERVEEEASEGEKGGRVDVVEEEDPYWPVDAEVGWGIRASEYFERHPIKNVVVDGVEIDWEGEMDEGWVKEINCLEWERFAFHPSPLIVLVFERYNR